ncbi:Demethylmenaquinone methyltransferase [Rhynchospora pubera]|uniref:Demethylmenaquinone methyltransferase n=1 Tax=Rhynchospora pubera TaxID=906938 RepID=A0AAV8GY23_9POAL|nr:Demethylmenaquinone methyltransferase [Rhynchospora pubera]
MEARAALASSSPSPALPPSSRRKLHLSTSSQNLSFLVRSTNLRSHHASSRRLRVYGSALTLDPETKRQQSNSEEANYFACPICYEPLIRKGPAGFNVPAIYRSGFKCQKCDKTFTSKDVFLDLTVTSGMKEYNEIKPVRTELFRSPLVSFLYERGWRQNFNRSGFPGPEEEFNMAQQYFDPVAGGLLVDVSCGSGLFSRKFAKSGSYSAVIALDFSENMLRQCYEFSKQDESLSNTNFALVRADVSRLPFASCSVDAVHAGAALHCWPSPSNAVAEISRILRSGGVFVGTTFLSTRLNNPFSNGVLRPLRQFVGQTNSSYNYFTEKEIEDLCKSCGLINYSCKIQQAFIMFSAQKP